MDSNPPPPSVLIGLNCYAVSMTLLDRLYTGKMSSVHDGQFGSSKQLRCFRNISLPWYLYKMVAQDMLLTYDVKRIISERKKIGSDNSFDVTKYLQQIKIPD